MNCPNDPTFDCPHDPCTGGGDEARCSFVRRKVRRNLEAAAAQRAERAIALDPAIRDRVNACPDRGGVLPISMQDDCGCQGKELSECRAGKGAMTGRVTLADCLACQG